MSGVKSFCSVFFPSWREHHQPKWKKFIKNAYVYCVQYIIFREIFNIMIFFWIFQTFIQNTVILSTSLILLYLPAHASSLRSPPFPIPYQVICILLFPSTFLLPSSVFTSLPFPKEPPGFHFPDQIIWPPTISLSVAPHPMHYHNNSTVLHSYFL